MCDVGVSDSKFSHSYPFFSAYIVVWYFFLVEMVCRAVYFDSICRSPNSVQFFSFSFETNRSWCAIGMLDSFVRSVVASLTKESAFSFPSIPWCDGIQVIIICLWSLVSSVYVS